MIKHTNSGFLAIGRRRIGALLGSKSVGTALIAFILLISSGLRPLAAAEFDREESRLVIHGFLSQAYANSSGGQFLGIPADGTSDYRNAALQFRYLYSPKDAFVLQFSNSRLGSSPTQDERESSHVEVNWVFYQRQLLEMTSIKIGKFPVPFGIYNETLHVGVVFPFYRAPFMMYGDGAFTSETINGAGLYQTFAAGDWALEVDLYAGEWTFLQDISGTVFVTHANKVFGGQVWLNTPLEGLRLGIGGNRSRQLDIASDPPETLASMPNPEETAKNWRASVDANFERFIIQGEYQSQKSDSLDYHSYYVLAGVKLFDNLGIHAQAEVADLTVPGFVSDVKLSRDYGVGLRYAFRPNLVFKAEHHWMETYVTDVPIVSFLAEPIDVKYYIVSLSASF